MKASYFVDSSDTEVEEPSIDSDEMEVKGSDDDDESVDNGAFRELRSSDDSDDVRHANKRISKINNAVYNTDDDNDNDSDKISDTCSSSSSESDHEVDMLDTNIGFSWNAYDLKKKTDIDKKNDDQSESECDSEEDKDEVANGKERSKSRQSRKRQAKKRREEQETLRRENALADGTADDNPETADDFERLLATDRNNSELWIRYMVFYLSLADIPSARKIAEKAFGRIEFRLEKDKLNVLSALLTLEHKFGSDEAFQKVIDEACTQNNSKQVYLKACEVLVNDVEKSFGDLSSTSKADRLFKKMCNTHKTKKKVWLAYMHYLLRQSRHQDAHSVMKRAMLSLIPSKHAETMSKFAQMEFELGSPERGRTIFDGLLLKYNKRLDIFYVR
jgi:rRNA biogenesis protein RRP5